MEPAEGEVLQSVWRRKIPAQRKTYEQYGSMIMGFLSELSYPFDPALVLRRRKALRRELLAMDVPWLTKKIAVLGGSSTQDIVATLDVFLLNEGIKCEFYESEYSRYQEEALFDNPKLKSFAPDIILFHTSWRNLRRLPKLTDSKEAVQMLLEQEKDSWRELWESVERRYHCVIIQNNFELPPWRILGNLDAVDFRGGTSFISSLNNFLQEWAREHKGFYLHDLNYVAADYGLSRWHNPSGWYLYKYAMDVMAVPAYAYSLTILIRAMLGKSKKALALDLDNTLWGGVVGDDGVEGIILGPETAQGEAYQEFQEYLSHLKELGVLLTINSKNDENNALAGMRHPHGRLRPEDFAQIKANWQRKDLNLEEMAAALSIGVDSFVFVDDNPAERALVTASLPQVAVPALDRVESYIKILDRAAWFEPVSLTDEDLQRGRMYAENARRQTARRTFEDYGAYLASLEMESQISSFSSAQVPRITQLTNKTNQFNLTTRRYTEAQIRSVMGEMDKICLAGTLADKYGDNGLVSVMIGEIHDEVCNIVLWLMSCRVLKRDMEYEMLNALLAECKKRKIRCIRGTYIPTAKNGMVADLFQKCGFSCTAEGDDGTTTWELAVASYISLATHIKVIKE